MFRVRFSRLTAVACIAWLLVACGSSSATPTGSAGPVATTTPTRSSVGATTPVAATVTRMAGGATPAVATRGTSAASPVVGATPQLPVTVSDKDGRPVTISDVSRTIALTGDVAEIIWALGWGSSVIATDTSAIYPPEAKSAPKIGYMRSLSAEGILALKPTVVIGNDSAGPPAVLEQLRGAGVPVLIIANPSSLDTPAAKIRTIATAMGIPATGEALARQTQMEIDTAKALAAKATSKPRVAFLNLRGNQVQQLSGKGAPAQAVIEAAGGIDAGAAAGISGYKPLTPEGLVTSQPEVYLLFTLSLESVGGVDGLLAIPGVTETPAGQQRRVLHYEDQYLLGFGPRTGKMLHELTLALHPELR